MAMTSSSQVPRLLALVPYLQAHPDADLEATASVFDVTPRQLVADLKVLWFCGLPGGAPGDLIEVDMDALESGTIRLTNAEFLARPHRFTPEEAMSLVVALAALRRCGFRAESHQQGRPVVFDIRGQDQDRRRRRRTLVSRYRVESRNGVIATGRLSEERGRGVASIIPLLIVI